MKVFRRTAGPGDIELLFEINCAALKEHVVRNFGVWDDDFQHRSFLNDAELASHELFFDGAQPVGFWCIKRNETELSLERLSLLPQYQNRGLGSSLVRELITEARFSGRALRLQVFIANRARRLYERLGFRIVRATQTHYEMEFADLTMEVAFLADRPELVRTVAKWWLEAWPHAGRDLDDVIGQLAADLHRDRIPIQLIALENATPIGSVVLKQHELRDLYPELETWLGNVFVVDGARGRGVASALCARVIDLALDLGLPALHLQTQDVSGGLYGRLGWQPLDRVVHNGVDTLIMKRQLPPCSAPNSAQATQYRLARSTILTLSPAMV